MNDANGTRSKSTDPKDVEDLRFSGFDPTPTPAPTRRARAEDRIKSGRRVRLDAAPKRTLR